MLEIKKLRLWSTDADDVLNDLESAILKLPIKTGEDTKFIHNFVFTLNNLRRNEFKKHSFLWYVWYTK